MKPSAAFLSAILFLACIALPALALESKVFTVSEKTLSVDLGPNFEITKSQLNTSSKGMISQDFVINDTAGEGGAFISIMEVYDGPLSKMSSRSLSEIFLVGGMSAAQARGDIEIGNWTAVDRQGENVTVHALSTKDERIQMLDGRYYTAVWNLDTSNYAVMVSLLDKDNTTKMIKTLTII